jgi:hypothetical protein
VISNRFVVSAILSNVSATIPNGVAVFSFQDEIDSDDWSIYFCASSTCKAPTPASDFSFPFFDFVFFFAFF